MSTFYLLPPREFLGRRLAAALGVLLPGANSRVSFWSDLADFVAKAAAGPDDVYVVYREDLPEEGDPVRALAEHFGAEAGDEVVEIRPGVRAGDMTTRRWRLGDITVHA
jgi:hypothetical protein